MRIVITFLLVDNSMEIGKYVTMTEKTFPLLLPYSYKQAIEMDPFSSNLPSRIKINLRVYTRIISTLRLNF